MLVKDLRREAKSLCIDKEGTKKEVKDRIIQLYATTEWRINKMLIKELREEAKLFRLDWKQKTKLELKTLLIDFFKNKGTNH